MKPHMGTIRNAHRERWGDATVVIGDIYGHPRFTDGHRIHTSRVVSENSGVVETLNSTYSVEWEPCS